MLSHADAALFAKNLDTSPWAKQLPLHRMIVDVIRLGTPYVAEQTVIHVINSFLEAAADRLGPLNEEGKRQRQ